MKYIILTFLFFITLIHSRIDDLSLMPIEEYEQSSNKKLKFSKSLHLLSFEKEEGVVGYIKKIQYNTSLGKIKNPINNHMQTAYVLRLEWLINVLDEIDDADCTPVVEEIQLIVPPHLLEFTESAVKKYRKVYIEGRFIKGVKDNYLTEIVMDVKSIGIVK